MPEIVIKMGAPVGGTSKSKAASRAQVKQIIDDAIAASAKKSAAPVKPVVKPAAKAVATPATEAPWTPYTDAARSVSIAAENLTNPVRMPEVTEAEIAKCGGGVLGYLRACRARQRGDQP